MSNAAEIQNECTAIAKSVGPKAYVSVTVKNDVGLPVSACCYFDGIVGDEKAFTLGKTFEEALRSLRNVVESRRAEREAKTIRAMAVSIIQLTADYGECTDAALRAEFSNSELEAYGEAAIEQANQLSANRPFNIVAIVGANAA